MPPARTYHQRSFAPFPITYSSESFAPLVQEDRQIAHVRYLLRGQHAALTRFRHYLTDCSMIFALEQTLQELQDNRDYVFADFTTPDVVYRLQPFLIQSCRRSLAPVSIATTTTVTSTDSTYSRPSTRRYPTAPRTRSYCTTPADTPRQHTDCRYRSTCHLRHYSHYHSYPYTDPDYQQ